MAAQELVDQRLDAIDRALLGLLPRNERLAVIADVESRIRSGGHVPAERAARTIGEIVASGRARSGRQRSRLALTAGIVGLAALGLLVLLPMTYIIVASIADAVGEEVVYAVLGLNIIAVALAGVAAVLMGIIALVRLARSRGGLGHGWAITGLCSGPMPALAGGIGMLVFVLPLTMELISSVSETSNCPPAYATAPVTFVPANPLPPVLPPASGYAPVECAPGHCSPATSQPVSATPPTFSARSERHEYRLAPLEPSTRPDLTPTEEKMPEASLPEAPLSKQPPAPATETKPSPVGP